MGRPPRQAGVPAAVLAFSLAALPAAPCLAQSSVQSTASSGKPLVVGWAELGSGGVGAEYGYAGILVPRQLKAALAFVTERYPEDEEFAAAARASAAAELEAARNAVAAARAKRDLSALSVRDPARRAAELLTAEAAVEKAEAALAEVIEAQAADAPGDGSAGGRAEPEGTVPVALTPWAGHSDGSLLPAVDQPGVLCAEKKLDLLVYGKIRPRGAYLAVELSLYVAALGRDVWTATDYAFADGLEDAVAALTRPAAEALLGRPYARADFRASPPVVDLYVDGKLRTGSPMLFFEAGRHEALARADGFETSATTFDAEPGSDVVVELSLAERPAVGLTLNSQPEGAAVHIDGKRIGYAPLDVPGSAYPRVARVSMPGFDDAQLVIRPEAMTESVTISLAASDGLKFDDRFDDRKGAFYRSLGWFVASLPVAVLSGGLFQTYFATSSEYADNDDPEADVVALLDRGFYTSQTVFWASAAASVGLAVNAIVRLALYIGSAQ